MAKRRAKVSASKAVTTDDITVLEMPKTPCDLANEVLHKKYGKHVTMTRELYEELSGYREYPTEMTKDWLLELNDLSKRILKVMVSNQSITDLCPTCGGVKSTIEMLHRPLLDVLSICDKYANEQ